MKKFLSHVLPWIVTSVALYIAFKGVDWDDLIDHIRAASVPWIGVAFGLTSLSYLLRSRRWQALFVDQPIGFRNACKVLLLGFFMNNVLPARTGELVRAHMGSRVTGLTRTLVLATIASERLADGLALSLMFVLFAFHRGDAETSKNLFFVAIFFAAAVGGVVLVLLMRHHLFQLAERLGRRFHDRASAYVLDRFRIFIDGLAPLCAPRKIPIIVGWSAIIWSVELGVFAAVAHAFKADLGVAECVLFLVTVNFSSLIPAAPGGLGVIEAIASAVLVSIGVPKELALTMVITQHVVQYLVVGIPGAVILATSGTSLRHLKEYDDAVAPAQG